MIARRLLQGAYLLSSYVNNKSFEVSSYGRVGLLVAFETGAGGGMGGRVGLGALLEALGEFGQTEAGLPDELRRRPKVVLVPIATGAGHASRRPAAERKRRRRGSGRFSASTHTYSTIPAKDAEGRGGGASVWWQGQGLG